MPALSSFDYAIIRVVPRVERGEFVNAGAILFCRAQRFLAARVELDPARLTALAPWLDPDDILRQLTLIPRIAAGEDGDPIARLPQAERFHWLVAPSSTIIQPSPVHSGLCADPAATLEHLLASMVQVPGGQGGQGAKGARGPRGSRGPSGTRGTKGNEGTGVGGR